MTTKIGSIVIGVKPDFSPIISQLKALLGTLEEIQGESEEKASLVDLSCLSQEAREDVEKMLSSGDGK